MTATTMASQILEYLDERAEQRRPKKLSRAALDQYRFVLQGVWLPWCKREGITTARDATDKVVGRFTDYLEDGGYRRDHEKPKPLAIQTVRTYVRNVRLFLNWASVPKGDYKAPQEPKRLLEILSREEIDAIEKAAGRDERNRLIVRLLANTGLRVSELLGLRAKDLRDNPHSVRVIGKGNKERQVPVEPPELFKRLRSYAQNGESEGDYLFLGRRRSVTGVVERLTPSGTAQLIRNLAHEAG